MGWYIYLPLGFKRLHECKADECFTNLTFIFDKTVVGREREGSEAVTINGNWMELLVLSRVR
jgi:hypothetical protein